MQASVAATSNDTVAPPEVHSDDETTGHVMMGAVISATTTSAVQALVSPHWEVQVKVTSVLPGRYGPTGDCIHVSGALALLASWEPASISAATPHVSAWAESK